MDYQAYRAGRATGAKGEVEKVVEPDEPRFVSLDNLLSVGQQYNVAQAPLHHAPRRTAANCGLASSASSQLHQAKEASPEHPTHVEGTHRARAAIPTTGCGDDDTWPDKQASWDSKGDVLSEMSHLPVSIKNTFLHLPEDDEDDLYEEEQMVSLPPPLDFLPSTVSADKLKAYRLDYQKFRSGKSSGAKGEVSETWQQ